MATKTFTGEIAFLNVKKGQGARGPWKAYSAKIVKEDGEEYEEWVNFGFKKPECEKGDSVVITCVKEKGFWAAKDVEITAKASKDSDEEDSESGEDGTAEESEGESAPQASSSSKSPTKDQRIQYQHSQEMALQLTDLLLQHKAIPLSATAGAAGVAARFKEITETVNKLTVILNNDVATGRLVRDIEDVYEAPAKGEDFDGEDEGEGDSDE